MFQHIFCVQSRIELGRNLLDSGYNGHGKPGPHAGSDTTPSDAGVYRSGHNSDDDNSNDNSGSHRSHNH